MFCLLGLGQFGLTILVLFWIFVLLPIYFVPSYIAFKKQKLQKTAIVVLNVFLGWTFLGWVVALVWACMEDGTRTAENRQDYSPEKITKKTIVTASISLFTVVTFIYLSWIFRGERWNQSEIDREFNRYTQATEDLQQYLREMEDNEQDEQVRKGIEITIIRAGDYLTKGLAIQNESAKVFWANALDVIANGASDPDAVLRAQILESRGFFAYRKSFDQNFAIGAGQELARENVVHSVAQFKPMADGINKLIEQRVGDGDSLDDILNDANFDSFANCLAMADPAVNREIQYYQNRTDLDQAEKDARIQKLTSLAAEIAARDRFAVAQSQKEIAAGSKKTQAP